MSDTPTAAPSRQRHWPRRLWLAFWVLVWVLLVAAVIVAGTDRDDSYTYTAAGIAFLAMLVTFGCAFLYWAGLATVSLIKKRRGSIRRPLAALATLAVGTGFAFGVAYLVHDEDPVPTAVGGAVSAAEWASGMCAAGGRFLEVSRSGVGLQESVTERLIAGDTVGARDLVAMYLDSVAAAADAFVSDLAALGAPDVPGGERLAPQMTTAMARVADAYAGVATDVRGLPTGSPAVFLDGYGVAITRLESTTASIGEVFAWMSFEYDEASELDEALLADETCRSVQGRLTSQS